MARSERIEIKMNDMANTGVKRGRKDRRYKGRKNGNTQEADVSMDMEMQGTQKEAKLHSYAKYIL